MFFSFFVFLFPFILARLGTLQTKKKDKDSYEKEISIIKVATQYNTNTNVLILYIDELQVVKNERNKVFA